MKRSNGHDERRGREQGSFLKPTGLKLVFLVEWTLFILLEWLRGELGTGGKILVASYPLVFFYLVACVLVVLSQHTRQVARGWKLLALALGLAAVDQFIKTMVGTFVPYQSSAPIIEGWLHLAHKHNLQGSWLLSIFNLRPVGTAMLTVVVVAILSGSAFCHRYYVATKRESVWADVAFLGLFAGSASWVCDMGFRGYIVDYIHLPGVVTADFKDILLAIGAAALFVEMLENPDVSLRWSGWRQEAKELLQLGENVVGFSIQELRGIRQGLMKRLRKDPRG
jgi:lipoprotein signal peptidase